MVSIDPDMLLRRMLDAAIASADPSLVLAHALPEKPKGRCIVIGAGKSAAAMARAVELAWPDVALSGVVVTRYGHSVPTKRIKVLEAAHPVPDAAGAAAAKEIMQIASSGGPDDLVLALISGCGSALMPQPVPPLTLADKIEVNALLLASGLTIDEMNRVRRRLSLIKGGGLARACGESRLVTLAISDVPGDAPEAIASGPTVPDPTADADLSDIVTKLGSGLPDAVRDVLLAPCKPSANFVPYYRLIATPKMALDAAAKVALDAGVTPLTLGDALEGEACELGIAMAGIAKSVAAHDVPAQRPTVLLSGGETTVTIGDKRPGRGGRNTEFLLSLAVALEGAQNIHAVAADTDGIDGTEDAAGALIGPTSLAQAKAAGLAPKAYLAAQDNYKFFDQINALIKTGPTLTNVNDFRAILIV